MQQCLLCDFSPETFFTRISMLVEGSILINAPVEAQVLVTDIVVRIPWLTVSEEESLGDQGNNQNEFFSSLLDVVLRCAARKENLQDCKASYPQVMNTIYTLQWNLIDSGRLNDLLFYFVNTFGIDLISSFQGDICRLILRLLEKAAEFLPLAACQTLEERRKRLEKRRIFVDSLMKCLIFYCSMKDSATDFAGRYFVNVLDRIEVMIRMIGDPSIKVEEADTLLESLLKALNEIDAARYFDAIRLCLFSWLDSHSDADLLPYFLMGCGRFVINVQVMLCMQEKCISTYFQRGHPRPSWSEVGQFLFVPANLLPNYVTECKSNGHFLSIYAFFMQQLPCCAEIYDETLIIRYVLSVLETLKDKHTAEPVMLMIVGLSLELLGRQLQFGGSCENISILISQLEDVLKFFSCDSKSGLLGAIGWIKRPSYTNRLKLISLLLLSYLQHQMLESGQIRILPNQPVINDKRLFVESLKTVKQYADFKEAINLALAYLSADNAKTFLECFHLYSELVLTLYNEKYLIDKCRVG